MSANVQIFRKSPISIFLLILLTIELTILGAAASAQSYGTGPAAPSSPSPTGNAMSSGAAVTPIPASAQPESGDTTHAGITATLLGVPVYGMAPLTVDFYVGLANPHGALVYQWNFGDGAVSSLPAGVYMLHVYRHPGTYLCSLNLTPAQGPSTTLFTTIVVQPQS